MIRSNPDYFENILCSKLLLLLLICCHGSYFCIGDLVWSIKVYMALLDYIVVAHVIVLAPFGVADPIILSYINVCSSKVPEGQSRVSVGGWYGWVRWM